ncbi:MAG: AAA family ATPase, partial [Desulfurococcaceae archaeon]
DAPILLLDEPTLGLDPPSARRIRELVRELARSEKKAIIYTTHNMFEAEMVCDKIIMINKGQIVAEGTPGELKDKIPKLKILNLMIRGRNNLEALLKNIDLKYEFKIEEGDIFNIKIHSRKPEDILDELLKKLINNGFEIITVKIEEPTLEDVFIYFSEGAQ